MTDTTPFAASAPRRTTQSGRWPPTAVTATHEHPPWRVRDFHEDDLDQAIGVRDQSRSLDEAHPVSGVSEVISAARSGQPAVVAVVSDDLAGMAAAQPQGERAWISVVALSSIWRKPRHRQCSPRQTGDPAAHDGGAAGLCTAAR